MLDVIRVIKEANPAPDKVELFESVPNRVMPAQEIYDLLCNDNWDKLVKAAEMFRSLGEKIDALLASPGLPGYVEGL